MEVYVKVPAGPQGAQGPTGENGLSNQFVVGLNTTPFPTLVSLNPLPEVLSTVTITIDDPGDTVRLMASIQSITSASSVNSSPLRANVIAYRIRRTAPNLIIRSVQDTDFDSLTTAFTTLDNPGSGTFTYVLEGLLINSTIPVQNEFIISVVFTAEEIEPN
ncbi:hypothetical protein JFV29_02555 [Peribacillus sp. TH16]|nr:hypothetical protein [Peribacillus sp. TH16]